MVSEQAASRWRLILYVLSALSLVAAGVFFTAAVAQGHQVNNLLCQRQAALAADIKALDTQLAQIERTEMALYAATLEGTAPLPEWAHKLLAGQIQAARTAGESLQDDADAAAPQGC